GNPRDAGKTARELPVLLPDQTREDIGLSVAQAHRRRGGPVHEGRQRLSGDVDVPAEAALVHDDRLENDLVVVGDADRHVQRYADLLIVVRDLRLTWDAACRQRLEGRLRHGDPVAEVQCQLSALTAPELRLREKTRLLVG